ncbi:MAG: hypothetical protein IIY77_08275 [Lachnospiraceae bacterium]|nr:hypothetical protein [Lachnospiraceae bacterium]
MEKGLIIGFDLCRDFCRVSVLEDGRPEAEDIPFSEGENPFPVQNALCKKKGEDVWLIGEEAYQTALFGGGTIVDKLLRLCSMNGKATFEGVTYSAEELLTIFIRETMKKVFVRKRTNKVRQIVFTLQYLEGRVLDMITRCVRSLGIEKKKIHIISHTEAYLRYVLAQKKELWSNMAVLFDLSQEGLNYYEMEILRGQKPNIARAERTFLEEGFSPDILDSRAGQRMADNIMTNCVERMLSKKLVSAAYLSGLGMGSCESWGKGFLKVLCQRRRVFYIDNLFAKGAALAAGDRESGTPSHPYSLMCEGRIDVDISVEMVQGVSRKTLTLAAAGTNWYEIRSAFDFIPDDEKSLRLTIKKVLDRQEMELEVPFTGFSFPGNKLKRIGAQLSFTSENSFDITLRDKGFGEFFPSSETTIRHSFEIE